MRIGIAQIDCVVGDVVANVQTITSMVRQAAETGCELVVLPEMADTGYDMTAVEAHASSWDVGPCRTLCEVAAETAIAVICGLSQREGDRVYNAAAVIDGRGELIGAYRKTHLFSLAPVHEERHFERGETLTVSRIGDRMVGVMVCYDLRFPELARALTLNGAEVLVVIAAWPGIRIEHWTTLNAARAIENQVYLAAANRVGSDGPMVFGGTSCLLDPNGRPVTKASGTEQTLLVGEIDNTRISEVRTRMKIFDDRRPDLYGALTE